MGTYGRGVTLDDESQHGLYAPGSQPLPQGPITREAGYWGYNEVYNTSQINMLFNLTFALQRLSNDGNRQSEFQLDN
jgi:hypothetical protein